MNTIEKRMERARLVNEGRALLDKAEAEKRELVAEELEQYDRIMAQVDSLRTQIDREERQAKLDLEVREKAANSVEPPNNEPGIESRAFAKYLRSGAPSLSMEESRALQAGLDTSGGYAVAPQEFVRQLIQAVDNVTFMRTICTVMPSILNAESLGAPSLETDVADPTWTSELLIGSEDSSMAFGKRELRPHPLAKYIKVTNTLLRQAAIDIEALVRQRLAYKMGVVMENAYLSGSGVLRPLGVFVASNDGIGTARDVSTGNTDTSIGTDGLIEAKFALKGQYWPRARWIFHRDAIKQIRKLKDGDGQYIWGTGVSTGTPDRILDLPYLVSEYAPNTFTTGQYVGILGDFSNYWIVDALNVQIQRLMELYAATNQTGFVARMESDGMPVLAEAFVRVKLA